jgi:hypothetical protein
LQLGRSGTANSTHNGTVQAGAVNAGVTGNRRHTPRFGRNAQGVGKQAGIGVGFRPGIGVF